MSIGEASVGALLQLRASVDDMCGQIKKLHAYYEKMEREYQNRGPVQVQLRGSTAGAATGNIQFGLMGPSQGRKWEIRRLLIGGSTFSSTVAGTAEVYVSAAPAGIIAAGRNLADMVDQAATLPSVAFYSAGQITMRYPQELKIVIVSPTASTPYECGGMAFDLPDVPAWSTVGV